MVISLSSTFAYAEGSTVTPRTNGVDFIAAYSLNLRDAQTAAGNIVVNVPKQSTLNNSDNGGWWWSDSTWTGVHYGSKFGYARNDLICPSQSCYKVTASSGLNLRSAASTSSLSKGLISYGEYVYIIDFTSSDWCEVLALSSNSSVDGKTGYVSRDYITRVYGI